MKGIQFQPKFFPFLFSFTFEIFFFFSLPDPMESYWLESEVFLVWIQPLWQILVRNNFPEENVVWPCGCLYALQFGSSL